MTANYGYYWYKKDNGDINKWHGYRCINILNGSCTTAIIGKIDELVIDEIIEKEESGEARADDMVQASSYRMMKKRKK